MKKINEDDMPDFNDITSYHNGFTHIAHPATRGVFFKVNEIEMLDDNHSQCKLSMEFTEKPDYPINKESFYDVVSLYISFMESCNYGKSSNQAVH